MVELTSVEAKVLRIVLDPAAPEGEVANASKKLVESLRRRGVSAYDIEEALSGETNGNSGPAQMSKADWGLTRMPFGRNKGCLFMDISAYDLRSTRRWCVSTPELATKFAELVHAIDEFMKQ
jgi:hypothetical protein